jgi:hypothetical protein
MTVVMTRTGINVDRKVEAEDDPSRCVPEPSPFAMIAVVFDESADKRDHSGRMSKDEREVTDCGNCEYL